MTHRLMRWVSYPSADTSVGWSDASCVYLPSETWSEIFRRIQGTNAANAMIDLHMVVHDGEAGRVMRKAPRSISGPRKRVHTVNVANVTSYAPL